MSWFDSEDVLSWRQISLIDTRCALLTNTHSVEVIVRSNSSEFNWTVDYLIWLESSPLLANSDSKLTPFHLGVVQNCQHLWKRTEGTLGGGTGWRPLNAFFLKSTFDVNHWQLINQHFIVRFWGGGGSLAKEYSVRFHKRWQFWTTSS